MLEEFRQLGMSEADLERLREDAEQAAEEEDQDFIVWPENADTVEFFLTVANQWRKTVLSSMGGVAVIYDALDYGAVESAMRMQAIARAKRPAIFRGLREMEAAAKAVLNER